MTAVRRIERSYEGVMEAASTRTGVKLRDASRLLRDALGIACASSHGVTLEAQPRGDEPPRIEGGTPIEGAEIRARMVQGEPIAGFSGFLDGIQRSRVIGYIDHVPLVHGAVAAAVRVREDRRLRTWDVPVISQAIYAPFHLSAIDALVERGVVRDTGAEATSHPHEYTARAVAAVQRTREGAEAELAARWVAAGEPSGVLLVDGGIRGLRGTATSARVVGVVKSHRTLYAPGEALSAVLGLGEGERTTAMVLEGANRVPVLTWYLRLRGNGERTPLFGLVRVEVATMEGDVAAITARADLVSRWILAERSPVALPDPRWDVMTYGIRDCEQYLSSILQ